MIFFTCFSSLFSNCLPNLHFWGFNLPRPRFRSQNDLKKWAWRDPRDDQKLILSKKHKNSIWTIIYYVFARSACLKIIIFWTQKSFNINEKMDLEKWQLKNRSETFMDRKWTPKVVQQGGPGATREPPFSNLETLWAALKSHVVLRPSQTAPKTQF